MSEWSLMRVGTLRFAHPTLADFSGTSDRDLNLAALFLYERLNVIGLDPPSNYSKYPFGLAPELVDAGGDAIGFSGGPGKLPGSLFRVPRGLPEEPSTFTPIRSIFDEKVEGVPLSEATNSGGGLWKGAGPIPGTIGVNSSTGSVKALLNYAPNKGVEFVFDPDSSTFVVGNGSMKHSPLAASIGADTNSVVGGIFTRDVNGTILTDEGSGHFWENWTPEVRQQYVEFMRSKGIDVTHTEGK